MNRWDEIMAKALDTVGATGLDDAAGRQRAEDLIELVGLMIQAGGKVVAGNGESDMNGPSCDDARSGHIRYLAGQDWQRAAALVMEESKAVELDRHEKRGHDSPDWRPRCPGCKARVGMHEGVDYSSGERVYDTVGHADGCPTRCVQCGRSGGAHKPDCGRRFSAVLDQARPVEDHTCNRVTALDGDGHWLGYTHCGICGAPPLGGRTCSRCPGCGEWGNIHSDGSCVR